MERDAQLLTTILKEMVDKPEEVRVERVTDEMGVLLTIHIHKDDMGKVIGRMGKTAMALRQIMRAVGMKHNARVNMKVAEPVGGSYSQGAGDTDAADVRDNNAGGVSDL